MPQDDLLLSNINYFDHNFCEISPEIKASKKLLAFFFMPSAWHQTHVAVLLGFLSCGWINLWIKAGTQGMIRAVFSYKLIWEQALLNLMGFSSEQGHRNFLKILFYSINLHTFPVTLIVSEKWTYMCSLFLCLKLEDGHGIT